MKRIKHYIIFFLIFAIISCGGKSEKIPNKDLTPEQTTILDQDTIPEEIEDEVEWILKKNLTPERIAMYEADGIEPVGREFSDIAWSEYFIDKFSLNEKEQEMIGYWGFFVVEFFIKEKRIGDGPVV